MRKGGWQGRRRDSRTFPRLDLEPGALDPLVKEMVYLAVSASNGCEYCIRSHTAGARAKGMSDAMLGELMAVVGRADR